MTSLIAGGGSGRSVSVSPAIPAAASVTTIAFTGVSSRPSVPARLLALTSGRRAGERPVGPTLVRLGHPDRTEGAAPEARAMPSAILVSAVYPCAPYPGLAAVDD